MLLASCTSPYVHRIEPAPTSHRYQLNRHRTPIPPFRQVAIVPFADYSEITFLQDRGYPGNAVVEEIADQFVAHNVTVIPQEDVDRLLLDMGVLPDLSQQGVLPDAQSTLYNGPHTFNHPGDRKALASLRETLEDSGYTGGIAAAIEGGARFRDSGAPDSGVTTDDRVKIPNKVKTRNAAGLSPDQVTALAASLGVDAVVRGRILEYGLKKTPTLDPAYGLGILSRIAMGLDWLLIDWKDDGDFAAEEPREELRGEIDDFRFSNFGPVGWMGGPATYKSSAIVQVRIYVQDGRTGEVLWTNRAEVETTPFSIFHFDDQHLKNLFDEATHKAVTDAMQSFFYSRTRWGASRSS